MSDASLSFLSPPPPNSHSIYTTILINHSPISHSFSPSLNPLLPSPARHLTTPFFFFNDPAPPEIYPLPLPDPLPICRILRSHDPAALGRHGLRPRRWGRGLPCPGRRAGDRQREQRIQRSPHASAPPPVLAYFTSSTMNGCPTNSVFTTLRGVSVVTYIVNGTRDPVTAMRYA